MTTRDDILHAAIEAFAAHGEAGLSVRDVAARVDLTPMAIYRHFKNKQALTDAIVMHAVVAWRTRVAAIAPGAPFDWLSRIGDAYLDFALEQPRLYEAAFLVNSPAALRYPDDFLAHGSPAVSLQLDLIRKVISPRKASAADVLIIISGLSQGLVTLYRSGRIAGDERRFRALYRRALRRCLTSFTGETEP
jgi:AcrR family transcriptional regulator